MLTLAFTPEVIAALRHERFHHPHPHVQLKMEGLYLQNQGLPGEQIQRLCAISQATYYRYLQEYRELLRLLAGAYPGQLITIILDNARYQRCALVQEVAASLGIALLFLPPYSPNLNLIERWWRFVKKRCLYGKYYADSAAFQQAIVDCIAQAPTKHQAE